VRTEGFKGALLSTLLIALLILSVSYTTRAQLPEENVFEVSPGSFTVRDAPPLGEPYLIEQKLAIRNRENAMRTFTLSVRTPPEDEVTEGFDPIPNGNWIILTPAYIEIEGNSSDIVEIFLNIPRWENLTNQRWEAWISVTRMAEPGEILEIEYISKMKIETTEERLPDTRAPTVTITAPQPGISTDATSIILEATVAKDAWETYAEITVRIDATSLTAPITATNVLDAEGKLVRAVELVEGTNTISVSAQDVAGNWSTVNTVTVTRTLEPTPPEVQVDVKAGDWIKYDFTITGAPSGTPLPTWMKVEFLSVEGTTATVRVTMHMSDGTDDIETIAVDVAAGGETFEGLSGFVIPANSKVGDSINLTGYRTVTIGGETARTYAGASKTVFYASFSEYGAQFTYYWDKETGVMVEAFITSGSMTGTAKATETNIWQAGPLGLSIDLILLVLVAVITIGVIAFVIVRRKRSPTTYWKF